MERRWGLTEAATGKPAKSIIASDHQSFTSGDGQGYCAAYSTLHTRRLKEIDGIYSLDGSVIMCRV